MSDLIDVLSKFSVHDLARMLAERIEADSQSTFKNRHDLGGGITLFKQKGSSRWHCRVHQPADGIYDYRQSTRKLDLRDATSEAHQIALMLKIKLSSGVALKKGITFKTIANEIVQFYLKRSKPIDTYYISLIKNHLLPYFGEQEIASINDRSVRLFWNKYCETHDAPVKSLANSIHIVLRRILLEAKEQALISSIPDMSNKVETKNIIKGECWEPNQIKTIFDKLTKWQSLSPTNTDRVIFNLYCRFLYLTGIRTGNEALGVRWDDLKTEKDYYLKVRKGKMEGTIKEGREMIISRSGQESKVIIEVMSPLAKIQGFEKISEAKAKAPTQYLFELKRPAEIWRSFADEMEVEGTLYWFRHTYITNEILRGEPLAHIAAQVGNSVKMIERHYSHATMRRIRTAELDRNKKDK